jgi:hypothetical protein
MDDQLTDRITGWVTEAVTEKTGQEEPASP